MKTIIILGILLTLLTAGCISSQAGNNTPSPNAPALGDVMEKSGDAMEKTGDSMMQDENTAMEKESDTMMDGESMMKEGTPYIPFTQDAYNQAKADGKTIFLEFYANWCPICKAQAPALESGIAKIPPSSFVAFRVNYNDSDTDADEVALAKKYNITYQHTHLVVSAEEEVLLRSNESWTEMDVINKLGPFSE